MQLHIHSKGKCGCDGRSICMRVATFPAQKIRRSPLCSVILLLILSNTMSIHLACTPQHDSVRDAGHHVLSTMYMASTSDSSSASGSTYCTPESSISDLPSTDECQATPYLVPSPATPVLRDPTIVNSLLGYADTHLLLALRATSRAFKSLAEAELSRHVEIRSDTLGISLSMFYAARRPLARLRPRNLSHLNHARVVDLVGSVPRSLLDRLIPHLTSVHTVRLHKDNGKYPSYCPIPTSTLVLFDEPSMPDSDPGEVTHRLHKAVIHIKHLYDTNALWYHQILYRGASEVVIVFSDWAPPFTPTAKSLPVRQSDLRAVALGLGLVNAIVAFISPRREGCKAGTCVIIDVECVRPSWLGFSNNSSLVNELWREVAWQLERKWDRDHTQKFLRNLYFLSREQYEECTPSYRAEMIP